jgi:predicted ATP-grasp superfamily ATP-dependent carboligase
VTARLREGDQPTAVVVGLDCITGLQTARILADRGVPVVGVVADAGHFCARTRFARQIVVSPTSGEALIETLEKLAAHLPGPAVLIPCTDGAVLAISRWRERLGAYRFVLAEHDVIETLMDKVRFAEYALTAGLPIPATRLLRTEADALAAGAELTYPAVLKPALKTASWTGATKAKAFRVADADELLATWRRWSAAAGVMIAQSWIEGGESALYSANAYFDRDGVPRVVFIARKLRQWPPETGTSCLGEEVRDDAVREAALALFGGIGFRGLAYLELKRDSRTGERLIVEPNVGRPTGRSAIAECGGVELVYSAYRDALGEPLPDATEQAYRGVKWIYWRHDIQAALRQMVRGELSPLGWWRSVRGERWEAVFDRRDPRPFVADVVRTAGSAVGLLRRW